MSKIIREKNKAHGGITAEEKTRMDEHAKLWITRAMRTAPIEPDKIISAIEGIYAAANLKKPRIVIVPSPLVMAFAYGASAAIWYSRKNGKSDATDAATRAATHAATRDATYDATRAATHDAAYAAAYAATDDATYDATHAATYDATRAATRAAKGNAEELAALACRGLAGNFGVECARRWSNVYQGGNMWAGYDCYLTAYRDILGLELREHAAYAHWEQAAIHGGYRVMHEEFCIVSDFPEVLKVDDQNRPHCETGPSHRWRDGWSLYHWHGVKIPAEWIENKKSLDAKTALTWQNIEQRRAALEIVGWNNVLRELKARVIDEHPDPACGSLVEVQLPDLEKPSRFIRAQCGTKREFAIGVPPEIKTVTAAQAWLTGLPESQFEYPSIRT